MDDHEEFERVPWSELTAATSSRSKPLYLAAAVVVAVVAGVLAGRMLGGSDGEVTAPGTSMVAESAGGDADGSDETLASEVASGGLEGPGPYTEADLRAAAATVPELAAVARAEWFVTDYFTADLEPTGSADVLGALPAGAELPEMPQDSVEGVSYVEWARAFRVEAAGENLYRVGVLFRMLGAPPERGFYRLAVRAVDVTVLVSPDGGSTVVDLPVPVALPTAPEPEPWPAAADEQVPPEVVERAADVVRAWGTEARYVAGQPVEGGWRVVLTLADEVGNRWPVAVRIGDASPPS